MVRLGGLATCHGKVRVQGNVSRASSEVVSAVAGDPEVDDRTIVVGGLQGFIGIIYRVITVNRGSY